MSLGLCGKRLGFEEIFGSSTPSSSAKRSRCSRFGSPVRSSDFGLGPDDKLSILLRIFPTMERELVESVFNSHNHKFEDSVESLHSHSAGDCPATNELINPDSMVITNSNDLQGEGNTQNCHNTFGDLWNDLTTQTRRETNESSWVDIFVQEMMNASDLDDARVRASRVLGAFEGSIISHSKKSEEEERALMKEQLQVLLRDNQILKKAVAIQHDRHLEQEEKMREVQQLKNMISQCQEQVRNLEINNYTLKLHLQRAHDSSSIPSHFHPDIF
ncbi:hypothetical protein H6P81_016301 [Aristolochia fimbriata]|uniref:CUE domain-containing protein n=1 Tax=Aristolochia fimbriata TaxID=158543 RepID=A0AAV7EAZ9_ARIFI|nr:hypothetical protein H6P81_016301 [Aristolochia fimbriata]